MFKTVLVLLWLLVGNSAASAMVWKALFIAGDGTIDAFDNSQRDLLAALVERGLDFATLYTTSPKLGGTRPGLHLLTETTFQSLAQTPIAKEGEGCLIHMTSHGKRDEGFLLVVGDDEGLVLPPNVFAEIVNSVCGSADRVVMLISACYSGQFITEAVQAPNRIIMTSSRDDRTSFGCGSYDVHTYWDGCLIENVTNFATWEGIYEGTNRCVERREEDLGTTQSEPQAAFGSNAIGWVVME